MYGLEEAMGLGVSLSVLLIVYYLVVFGLSITIYVLRAMGMYTIAKRRGIDHPWMAWIPVADYYLLGSISDQYQYVVKGRNKAKRKWMLGLYIAMLVVAVLVVIVALMLVFSSIGAAYGNASEAELISMLMGSAVGMLVLYFVLIGFAVALVIIRYIALYDLYHSCNPGNSTLYIVLTILLGVVEPFFIFACRNKDEGMPPRKAVEPVGYIPQNQPAGAPSWQPPAEPAQQPEETPAQEASWQPEEEAVQQPAEEPVWQPSIEPVVESSWQPAEEIAWQPPVEDPFMQPKQEEPEPWNPADPE